MIDAGSGQPLAGALVEPFVNIEDAYVVAAPLRTDVVVRAPRSVAKAFRQGSFGVFAGVQALEDFQNRLAVIDFQTLASRDF